MFGTSAQAATWDESPNAGHTQALAPAPDGLSARRVERWLDLPPGAWQRRRLYALRLKGCAFTALGLRPGDFLIVEPGGREQPGKLVVTRGTDGPSLKRVALPAASSRMPTVLELPLRERTSRSYVVGAVLGVLRPTGTGALRPVGQRRPRSDRKNAGLQSIAKPAPDATVEESFSLNYLLQMQAEWREWLRVARQLRCGFASAPNSDRWERLDASLATLCDCLVRTHSPALRTALAAEAQAVATAIRDEMRG